MFARFAIRLARTVASVNPRVWFFLIGLALLWRGAESMHAGAGWLLCGLVLIWDASRETPPKK